MLNIGEWVDVYSATDIEVGNTPITYIPLGIAVKLPPGYEAIIASRSSTPKRFGIWNSGSIGVVDNSYSGNNDEWKYPATTIGCQRAHIKEGDRIAQFRIQLSQKATMWQRIKWLFTSGIRIVEVERLNGEDRSGFGSTGAR